MTLVCILALLAGAIFGYITLRSLGWLCIIGLCFIALDAKAISTAQKANTTGATGYFNLYFAANYPTVWISGSSAAGQSCSSITTDSAPGTHPAGVRMRWYNSSSDRDNNINCVQDDSSGGNWTNNITWCSTFTGGAPPNYYASGCVTNTGQYIMRFYFKTSYGGGNQTSPPIPPGSYWCVSATNSSPFTYELDSVTFNSDGGTNFFFGSGPYPAYTNNWPGTGGSGSTTAGTASPNNPVGSGAGAGSTNQVTGDQYANGISNLVNSIYWGNNSLLGGLASLMSSNGIGTNTDYTSLLNQIKTNTGLSSDRIGMLLTNMDGLLTNINQYMNWVDTNGVESLSNTAWTAFSGYSNDFRDAAIGNGRLNPLLDMTNIIAPQAGDDDVWTMTIQTNLSGATGKVDLNPMHNTKISWIMAWVRYFIQWFIEIYAIKYIIDEYGKEFRVLVQIPGGNIWKQPLKKILGKMLVAGVGGLICTSIPILLAGAIDTYFSAHGGFAYGPFSGSIPTLLGLDTDQARTFRAIVAMVDNIIPLITLGGTIIYLTIFDVARSGEIIFFGRFVRLFDF